MYENDFVLLVSWSRDGKTLLTASTDWNIILWDILTASIVNRIKFDSPVLYAEMYPGKEYATVSVFSRGEILTNTLDVCFSKTACVVCPFREHPQWVDLSSSKRVVLPHKQQQSDEKKDETGAAPTKVDQKISSVIAVFTRSGDQIYIGDADGHIAIVSTDSLQLIKSVPICPGSPIKSIVWARDEHEYLVNSTDKVIRLVNKEDHSVKFDLFDAVNKIQWKKCCFSGDGDHIVAGSAQKHEHKIYIWSRHFKNNLIRMLEGPKEGILDLVWHPTRPIAISCSTSGAVYIWNARYQESWSAFAPGFTELEENEEYIEREDEFDARDFEAEAQRKKQQAEADEDADVDIINVAQEVLSDDEELFFLPVAPIPDWQMAGGFVAPESGQPAAVLAAAAGLLPPHDLADDPLKATEQRRKLKAKRKAPTPGPSDENR